MRTFLLILFLLLTLIGTITFANLFKPIDNFFSNYHSAHRSNDWIPEILPNNSINIHQQYWVDSEGVRVKFDYLLDGLPEIYNDCTITKIGITFPRTFLPNWWDKEIVINGVPNFQKYQFYYCKKNGYFVALSKSENSGFIWKYSPS
jgi:hypothetical protein